MTGTVHFKLYVARLCGTLNASSKLWSAMWYLVGGCNSLYASIRTTSISRINWERDYPENKKHGLYLLK
jgi:hypothetical protein